MYNQANFNLNIKSINRINISYNIFVSYKFSNFFWIMFNSKAIKIDYIIIIKIQSYLMCSYWFILIKIYFECPILYFRSIISWINTIKFRLILIILLRSKFFKGWGGIKNPGLLQLCLSLIWFCLYLLIRFLIN